MNKETRLKIYKEALIAFNGKISYHTINGFCNYFAKIIHLPIYGGDFTEFPELYNQKPKKSYKFVKNKSIHYNFWWKPNNRKIRARALKAAIEEIEQKLEI